MFIKKLQLRNGYKRFYDLTIDLGDNPARIIAMVGPNGCGKSSVFDGILYHQAAFTRLGQTDDMDYTYHSLHGFAGYDYENIVLDFTTGSYSEVMQQKGAAGKENTIFSFRSPYRHNSNVKISEIRSVNEIRYNDYGASSTNALDQKMEQNYRRIQAEYSRYRDEHDVPPSAARDYIIGELNKSLRSCLDLSVVSLGDVESRRGTLYFEKPDQPAQSEFNVLSAGEKEVIDILLDLYLRKEDYDDTVFLIDEPELHINTAVQRKLLGEINKLIGDQCQIWIATHSAGFLRALQDDYRDECQVIRFDPSVNFGVDKLVLKPMLKTRANWLEIFKTALDDLSQLVAPRRIIYCEGRAEPRAGEERGLDAQVYNKIFGEAYPDTLFVSSGGNTEPTQRSEIAISILGKVLIGLEILVLVDRDFASGEKTTDMDRDEYLENHPSNHRVLRRWEMENYLYDSEVLERYCLGKGRLLGTEKYDTLVSNIHNDDVKEKTAGIKSACGVKSSISVNKFKLRLAECIEPGMAVYDELHECIFQEMA